MKVLVWNESFSFVGAGDVMVKTRNSRLRYKMCERVVYVTFLDSCLIHPSFLFVLNRETSLLVINFCGLIRIDLIFISCNFVSNIINSFFNIFLVSSK